MQEGLYTVVIRISGNQDPMNDNDATVEIGYSPDKIVRDARANVAPDYSYRIVKSEQYTKLKARISNGVVETEQVDRLHVPRIGWFPDQMGDADFHKGTHAPEHRCGRQGGLGRCRRLSQLAATFLPRTPLPRPAAEQGIRDHEDAVGLYYALKRNADGMPDPKTGRNTGISMAYRIKAVPAHVVDSKKPAEITVLTLEEKRRQAYLRIEAMMIAATTTRVLQDVPPGTSEAAFPAMERDSTGIPIRDYLLKTLDRPHFNGVEEAREVPQAAPAR